MMIFVMIFILPLLSTLALSFTIDLTLLATEKIELAGYLRTMAVVLATLTGLLLTVTALTIHVKTSNLAGADFLLNAVIRRRGFLPIAAFLSGTILTALAGMLFSDMIEIDTLNNFTWVTALLCFISVLVLFDLLRKTMQTLGINELEELLRGELLATLRKSFRSTLRQALVERNFSEKLADLGFARYKATPNKEDYPIMYKLKGLGKIVAMDPAPLRRISHILKLTRLPRERNTSSFLIPRPDDSSPLITIPPNGNVTKDTQLALSTKEQEQNKQIARLTRKVFIIKKHTDVTLPWERLRELVYHAIVNYRSTTVRSVGNALSSILDDYLEIQLEVAGKGKLLLEDFIGDLVYEFKPPSPFNLRFSDLVVYAGRNHSQDCLDELLTCIYKLARNSFEKHNEKYFRNWIFQFYWAYHSFRIHKHNSEFNIATDITRRIHWLSDMLSMSLDPDEKSADKVKNVTPYAISYFSLCLNMLKTSAERCHESTFESVLEHVEKFLEHELREAKTNLDLYRISSQNTVVQPTLQPDNDEQLLIAYNELLDYKNLVYVIAGAWLMRKVKAKEIEVEKVDPYLKKLIAKSPSFRFLLNLYAMPGMADMTTSHDNPLGFDGWDRPYSSYPESRWGTIFQRWIEPFYQFLLLKKAIGPGAYGVRLQNIRQTQNASHESLKKFLCKIADDSYSLPHEYQNFLDTTQLDRAKKCIKKITSSFSNNSDTLSSDG